MPNFILFAIPWLLVGALSTMIIIHHSLIKKEKFGRTDFFLAIFFTILGPITTTIIVAMIIAEGGNILAKKLATHVDKLCDKLNKKYNIK